MKRTAAAADWRWAAGLFLLTFLAYLPSLRGTFIWDDGVMVADNPMLRSAQGLRDFWITTRAVDPLPMTMTALWLQWRCWAGHPAGYHVIGILLHACGALLFWRVLLHFTKRPRLAWLAAALFALHPVTVASAGWISEQKNTISSIFYFLSILAWLKFEDGGKAGKFTLALLFFICAVLSKGSVVMLPVILLLIVWWREGHVSARYAGRLLPFFIISVGAALGTIWIQNHKAIVGELAQDINGPARIAAAARAVWFYFAKDIAPIHLSAIYPTWHINAASMAAWLPMLALVVVFVVAWRFRRSWGRHVLLGFGCFVITLFPVMGFFNMYFLIYSRVADQWQYLALPPLIGLLVGGGGYLFERIAAQWRWPKWSGPLAAIALLALLFQATWTRTLAYTNERTLWSDTVAKNPNAWMAWNNLGNAFAADHEVAPSIEAYRRAIELRPNFPDAESNLGNALIKLGQIDEAVSHLGKAVEEESRVANFHFNYGVGLAAQGRLDDAIAQYQLALERQPRLADARNNLSSVLYQQKKYDAALEQARVAMQINPDLVEPYINVAKDLAALERTNEAAQNFEIFLRLRPDNAGGHFEYGMMLAMHGDLAGALPQFQAVVHLAPNEAIGHSALGNTLARLKRPADAAAEFLAASRLQPNDVQNENNLANALLESGKTDEALSHYANVIKLNGADAGLRVEFAHALLSLGKRAEAIEQLRAAARLRPGDPAIEQQLDAAQRQQ